MRQQKRQVTDKATICAMLDEMDTINLGMYDEPFPYVVPLNFGYEWNDELIFYFHCAHEGHKLDLLNRNPRVCVTASRFISYAGASVKGHLHDYRSVIARGVAQRIEQDSDEFIHAHEKLLEHNLRDPSQVHTTAMRFIELWRVVCKNEDVTAKAEIPPKHAGDVAFAPAVGDGRGSDLRRGRRSGNHVPGDGGRRCAGRGEVHAPDEGLFHPRRRRGWL